VKSERAAADDYDVPILELRGGGARAAAGRACETGYCDPRQGIGRPARRWRGGFGLRKMRAGFSVGSGPESKFVPPARRAPAR